MDPGRSAYSWRLKGLWKSVFIRNLHCFCYWFCHIYLCQFGCVMDTIWTPDFLSFCSSFYFIWRSESNPLFYLIPVFDFSFSLSQIHLSYDLANVVKHRIKFQDLVLCEQNLSQEMALQDCTNMSSLICLVH